MDKPKTRDLVSILMESRLYQTMSHEEKISLLLRLEQDYPSLLKSRTYEEKEDSETG